MCTWTAMPAASARVPGTVSQRRRRAGSSRIAMVYPRVAPYDASKRNARKKTPVRTPPIESRRNATATETSCRRPAARPPRKKNVEPKLRKSAPSAATRGSQRTERRERGVARAGEEGGEQAGRGRGADQPGEGGGGGEKKGGGGGRGPAGWW